MDLSRSSARWTSRAVRGRSPCATTSPNATVVYVGGGRDARLELELHAVGDDERRADALGAKWSPRRNARATVVRQRIKDIIEELGYVPEDNVEAAMERKRNASATFTRAHLEALQRDGYAVIDDAFVGDAATNAAAAARALYERGIMQNLRQEGRDDDVAVPPSTTARER